MTKPVSVLFVCLGNICRSPTAEGVFRRDIAAAGIDRLVTVDSAGTGTWHVGEAPDARAQAAARTRGIELSTLRARKLDVDDFARFDYVLAMDESNRADMLALSPQKYQHRVRLFLDFDPGNPVREVPDPFYGEAAGFEVVLDLIEAASKGLLTDITEDLRANGLR